MIEQVNVIGCPVTPIGDMTPHVTFQFDQRIVHVRARRDGRWLITRGMTCDRNDETWFVHSRFAGPAAARLVLRAVIDWPRGDRCPPIDCDRHVDHGIVRRWVDGAWQESVTDRRIITS